MFGFNNSTNPIVEQCHIEHSASVHLFPCKRAHRVTVQFHSKTAVVDVVVVIDLFRSALRRAWILSTGDGA